MKKLLVAIIIMLMLTSCKTKTDNPMEIINEFNNSELECINITVETSDNSRLPNVFESAYRCEIPQANYQGLRIFYFSNINDQDLVYGYYNDLPDWGGNESHIYVSGNFLLQTEKRQIKYDLLLKYLEVFNQYK